MSSGCVVGISGGRLALIRRKTSHIVVGFGGSGTSSIIGSATSTARVSLSADSFSEMITSVYCAVVVTVSSSAVVVVLDVVDVVVEVAVGVSVVVGFSVVAGFLPGFLAGLSSFSVFFPLSFPFCHLPAHLPGFFFASVVAVVFGFLVVVGFFDGFVFDSDFSSSSSSSPSKWPKMSPIFLSESGSLTRVQNPWSVGAGFERSGPLQLRSAPLIF